MNFRIEYNSELILKFINLHRSLTSAMQTSATAQEFTNWLETADADRVLRLQGSELSIGRNWLADKKQGHLSIGLPSQLIGSSNTASSSIDLSEFAFWFPRGLPSATMIFPASSRVGSQPGDRPRMFSAIRTLACRFDADTQILISHPGVALDRFVVRAAELFDLPAITLQPFPRRVNSRWIAEALESGTTLQAAFYWNADGAGQTAPDHLLMAIADQVRLLSVRSGGNVEAAALSRLESDSKSSGSGRRTWMLVDSELTDTKLSQRLLEAGAMPWWLYRGDGEERESESCADDYEPRESAIVQWPCSSVVPLKKFAESNEMASYLLHWTRSRKGHWPDQTEDQFLDDLLLGHPSSDHSRIAALCRILATGTLLGTSELTRDKCPVVCFSEVAVDQLLQRRKYRSHLGRWDFEPVGIAINRNWLVECGARPVVYGDDSVWKQLERKDRPWFQFSAAAGRESAGRDWREEQEWRTAGDLNLERLAPTDAFVFVETSPEAASVAPLSRWPVVVLSS